MEESGNIQDTASGEVKEEHLEEQPQEQTLSKEAQLAAEAKNYRLRVKRERETNEALKRELLELRMAQESHKANQLAADGKYKELYELERKEKIALMNERRRDAQMFKERQVMDMFEKMAASKGCIDPKTLAMSIDKSEFMLSDDLTADETVMEAILERELNIKPYFFSSPKPKYKTGEPAKAPIKPAIKTTEKMSKSELLESLKMLKDQGATDLF